MGSVPVNGGVPKVKKIVNAYIMIHDFDGSDNMN